MQRRRSTPRTFEDRIAVEKAKAEVQAAELRPGPARDALLKIRQLDTAVHVNQWLASPGLRPPE